MLEDKFSNLVSLKEIQRLKEIIQSKDYAGRNQVLIEMIKSQQDKIFVDQINQAKPEVRTTFNEIMKT